MVFSKSFKDLISKITFPDVLKIKIGGYVGFRFGVLFKNNNVSGSIKEKDRSGDNRNHDSK